MPEKKENKIALLLFIKERKDALFGKFKGTKDTFKKKQEMWTEVEHKAKELKVITDNKNWEYVRDTMWGNWKKRTLAKFDGRKQTGLGGGIDCKINEMDNIILDILGKESPMVNGLGMPDSLADENELIDVSTPVTVSGNVSFSSTDSFSSQKRKEHFDRDFKNAKMKLQLDIMEIEKRKLALELFKLELKYDVGPSKHTELFHQNYTK